MKGYKFKNWRDICEAKDAEIKRLNEAIDYVIERLTDEAQEREKEARIYDAEELFFAANIERDIATAYYDAANIVKEGVFHLE